MFDHQRALLSLSPSLVLFCVSLGSVCIRKKISSHKWASLPLFNAVCVSVRESKLCCLNADVLCCSSGPLIQVTSHKSFSSSSFITHFPSCRPPLPLSLFLWLDAWGGVYQPTGLKWGRLTADAHTSAQTAHSSLCLCLCVCVCVCILFVFVFSMHSSAHMLKVMSADICSRLIPGSSHQAASCVNVCVCVFVCVCVCANGDWPWHISSEKRWSLWQPCQRQPAYVHPGTGSVAAASGVHNLLKHQIQALKQAFPAKDKLPGSTVVW